MLETFTKKDLKVGMMLVYREGSLRKVHTDERYPNVLVFSNPSNEGDGGWSDTDGYTSELKSKSSRDLDIMEVYTPPCNTHMYFSFNLSDYELLWKRDESIIELTLQQVADKFKVNVKRLRILDYKK